MSTPPIQSKVTQSGSGPVTGASQAAAGIHSGHLTLLPCSGPSEGHAWPQPGRHFQALLQLLPETLLRVSGEGLILDYHPSQDNDLALPIDKVQGRTVEDVVPGQYAQQALEAIRTTLDRQKPHSVQVEIPVNSIVRELEVRLQPAGHDEVIALIRDVTDRQRLEKEILEISHREQQRIGQDLHDSLGQHLTGITFMSKALQKKLKEKNLPEESQAAEIVQHVVQTLAHTRNIARGLFPVELETTGRLVPALTELAENTEKIFRIPCRLEVEDGVDLHDAKASTELFRITQEAVSNALKHGKAKRVSIRLQRAGPETGRLIIHDDGQGLPASSQSPGLGLRIMSYRASRVGAHLRVSNSDLGGAVVECEFPLRPGPVPPGPHAPSSNRNESKHFQNHH